MRLVYLDPTDLAFQYVTGIRNDPNIPTSSYSTLVKRIKPTAYWRLDDTGGTAADSSGNGNTGTLNGGITQSVAGALLNDSDTAMTFNGSTGFIDAGAPADITTIFQKHDFSVEYWARPVSDSNFVFTCGTFNAASTDNFLHVGFGGSNQVKLGFFGDDLVGNFQVPTGQYSHIVVSWSATSRLQSIYINGVHDASRTTTGLLNVPTGSSAQIARASFATGNGPFFFNGTVDELALYNFVLTTDQIQRHYLLGAILGPQKYILTSGSDGAPDEFLQQYVAGINSLCPDSRVNPTVGVSAFYIDDATQDQVAKNLKTGGAKNLWINGILGGGTGDI